MVNVFRAVLNIICVDSSKVEVQYVVYTIRKEPRVTY